jgi:hypothetical protein
VTAGDGDPPPLVRTGVVFNDDVSLIRADRPAQPVGVYAAPGDLCLDPVSVPHTLARLVKGRPG